MDLNFANHMAESLPSLTKIKYEAARKHRERLEEFVGFDDAYNYGMESLIRELWDDISISLGRGKSSHSIGDMDRAHLQWKMVDYIMSNMEFSSLIDMSVATLDNLSSYKEQSLYRELENTPDFEKQTIISNFLKEDTEANYRSRLGSVVAEYLVCRNVPDLQYWCGGGTKISQCSGKKLRYLNSNTDFHSWFCDQIRTIVLQKGMTFKGPTPWFIKPGTKYIAIRKYGQIGLQ